MDIFNLFATRDLDLEAPILAEKEREGAPERIQPVVDIIDEEMVPANVDEIMEEVMLHHTNSDIPKQKCFTWIVKLPILRMSGMNSLLSTIAILTSPKSVVY